MNLKKQNKFNIKINIKSHFVLYIIILIASIFISIPLFAKDLNMFRDDGVQHICRLMGTYQSVSEGQIIPMIMSNFCNGFGYSWNIFYSPVTAYIPLLFKVFQMSFTNCIKIFMFVVTLLSGITMFKFVNRITKNKNIAVLSAIFYIVAPYRITDMYIRNALAELTSFVFIPMIFEGLYIIVNEKKKSYLLMWATIGLILSHTVITMYTGIICFIYLLVNIKDLKNKTVIKALLSNIVLTILITSFYWVPLLQHEIATNYEVFAPGRMERTEVLRYYKLSFLQLFYTGKNQSMIYDIGIVILIGLICSPIAYKKISKEYKKIYITFLVIAICLVIMTLNIFPFERLPSILKMIQFTFRLLEFTSFIFALIAAINYGLIIKNFKIYDVIIIGIISCLVLIPYNKKIEYKQNDENILWPAVQLTDNTGRVHAGMASLEYLPSKAFNNRKYIVERDDKPIIISGNADISEYQKNNTNMEMDLSQIGENTKIELPYIYYLGYVITYEEDGDKKDLQYYESENGFIEINVPESQENIKLNVKYTGTKAMKICSAISLFTLIIIICINVKSYIRLKSIDRRKE